MTDQHLITPPPKLLDQWLEEWAASDEVTGPQVEHIAIQAARWGADQELEACCDWLIKHGYDIASPELRDARRPKPQNLKEQALEVVTGLEKRWDLQCDLTLLRRALEQLDD